MDFRGSSVCLCMYVYANSPAVKCGYYASIVR